jgi:hypothetical protein
VKLHSPLCFYDVLNRDSLCEALVADTFDAAMSVFENY